MAKRSLKKRTSKKKGPPKERNLSRTDIKTIIKRMTSTRIETKHYTKNWAATVQSGAVWMANPFDALAQGTGANNLIGDILHLDSLKVSITIYSDLVSDVINYRVMGFWCDMKLPMQAGTNPSTGNSWQQIPIADIVTSKSPFIGPVGPGEVINLFPDPVEQPQIAFDSRGKLQAGYSGQKTQNVFNKTVYFKNKKCVYQHAAGGYSWFSGKNFYIWLISENASGVTPETTSSIKAKMVFEVKYKDG